MNKIIISILLVTSITGCGSSSEDTSISDSPNGTACVQPFNGLVGWWAGDGDSNDRLNSNNGQEINGASYASGIVDQAFSFDGVDDYITIANAAELNPISEITFSAWVKVNSNNNHQMIITKFYGNFNNGPNDDSYAMNILPDGGLGMSVETIENGNLFDNILVTGPVNIFDDKFHLIVGIYDGLSMKLYFDGKEVTTIVRSPGEVSGVIQASPDTTPLIIGAGSNGGVDAWFVDGLVDEVNIYSIALNSSQILELYNAGSKGVCKS